MATAKPDRIPRRQRWRGALIAVLALIALGIGFSWHRLQAQGMLATAYGARIACTCHYLGKRSLPDCRRDFEPGMALVMLGDDPPTRSITARLPLIASQTASLRDGAGCVLRKWAP